MSEIYLEQVELKERQKQMIELIKQDYPNFAGELLDIGCGDGILLKVLEEVYPEAKLWGVDIENAFVKTKNVIFIPADISGWQNAGSWDIIIASGILGIWDTLDPLWEWLTWLKEDGTLYFFGRFNSRDIDTIIHYRNNVLGRGWKGGLTSYSISTVAKELMSRGYEYKFKRFHLPLDVPLRETEDPIKTYRIITDDGSPLIVTGANIIAEHYFLTIRREGEDREF